MRAVRAGRGRLRPERPPARHGAAPIVEHGPAARPRLAGGTRRMGRACARRGRRAAGRAPRRHRHEPARPSAGRGRRSLAAIRASAASSPCLLMSHLVVGRGARRPVNARQIAAFATVRGAAFPACPGLARQFVRHLPRDPSRPTTSIRPGYALYGGNPTPGRPNPMRPVVRLEAPHRAGARGRAGRRGRLWRRLDRRGAAPARDALGRLCGRLSRAAGGTDASTAG